MIGRSPSGWQVHTRCSTVIAVALGLSALGGSAGCNRSEPADAQLESLRAENKRLREEIEQMKKHTSGPPNATVKSQSRSGRIVDGSGNAKGFEFIQGVKRGQPKVADPKNLVLMKEVEAAYVFVPIDQIATVEIGKDVNLGRTPITIKTKDGKQESHQAIGWWPIEVKWNGETAIHEIPVERFLNSTITFDK